MHLPRILIPCTLLFVTACGGSDNDNNTQSNEPITSHAEALEALDNLQSNNKVVSDFSQANGIVTFVYSDGSTTLAIEEALIDSTTVSAVGWQLLIAFNNDTSRTVNFQG